MHAIVSGTPDEMHSAGMLEAAQPGSRRVCWGCQWLLVEDLAAEILLLLWLPSSSKIESFLH